VERATALRGLDPHRRDRRIAPCGEPKEDAARRAVEAEGLGRPFVVVTDVEPPGPGAVVVGGPELVDPEVAGPPGQDALVHPHAGERVFRSIGAGAQARTAIGPTPVARRAPPVSRVGREHQDPAPAVVAFEGDVGHVARAGLAEYDLEAAPTPSTAEHLGVVQRGRTEPEQAEVVRVEVIELDFRTARGGHAVPEALNRHPLRRAARVEDQPADQQRRHNHQGNQVFSHADGVPECRGLVAREPSNGVLPPRPREKIGSGPGMRGATCETPLMRHRIFAGLGLGLLLLLGCPPTSERAGGAEADVGSKAPPAPAEAEASDLEPDRSDLPGIRERGDLRILLFGRGDSMLPRAGDPALLDEEMAVAFAKRLDLDPLLIRVEAQDELIPSLQAGRGDLIAAQLTVTPEREERVAFSRGRMTVDEVLVVPAGSQDAPEGAEGLDGRVVHVRPASSYQTTLAGLEDELDIDIDVRAAASTRTTVELVLDVAEGRIPLTVADRNILKAVTEFEDGVAEGPTLAEGRELAWAVRSDATELRSAVDRFVLERALTRHTRETYHADLDEIRRRGVLRVLTRNNAINYFLYRGSQFGFEFELMKLLAEELDVRLQMVVVPRRDLLIPWLLEGRGDVIAASLTDTEGRGEQVHFSRPYLYATQQIVRPAGADEPSRLEDLAGREVHVRRSSSFYPDVTRLNDAGIDVKVVAADEALETEQLIDRVAEGAIPLTVADSHVLDVEMAYGEKVEAALRLPVDEAALADALEGEGEPPADAGAKAGRDDAGRDDERGPVKIAFATRPDDEALAARIDTFVRSKYRG